MVTRLSEMGIKVEMEHTDDPKKAEKIALDHLAENPFYYTALKLSGIESPSAPKVKTPEEKKTKKKKDETTLVDKGNQMQKIKVVKEEYDPEIEGEPSSAYKSFVSQKKGEEVQAKKMMQATNSEGILFSVNDEAVAPDGTDIKISGFTQGKDGRTKAMYKTSMGVDVYDLDALEKKVKVKPGVNLGASFDKFKSQLEEIVREVLAEKMDREDVDGWILSYIEDVVKKQQLDLDYKSDFNEAWEFAINKFKKEHGFDHHRK